jgi:hypothetical protein
MEKMMKEASTKGESTSLSIVITAVYRFVLSKKCWMMVGNGAQNQTILLYLE